MTDLKVRPFVTHNLLKAYAQPKPPEPREGGFAALLDQSLRKTDQAAKDAGLAVRQVLVSQEQDLHAVMIAQEEAAITFELMLEVRNKLMEAYQQIMQMQI